MVAGGRETVGIAACWRLGALDFEYAPLRFDFLDLVQAATAATSAEPTATGTRSTMTAGMRRRSAALFVRRRCRQSRRSCERTALWSSPLRSSRRTTQPTTSGPCRRVATEPSLSLSAHARSDLIRF